MDSATVTDWLDRGVLWLQTLLAALLVALFLAGVINLAVLFGRGVLEGALLDQQGVLSLVVASIDVLLTLFIVVELYRTVIAYVEGKSVVLAVIHAGLIAVVRQIITFKPGDGADPLRALLLAGSHAVLLLALLAGFYLVHREVDEPVEPGTGE